MITVKIRAILQKLVCQWMPLVPLVWLQWASLNSLFSNICHLLPFVKVGQYSSYAF